VIRSLPDALRETALRLPDHEAVRWQGESVTWAELWCRASHLASILRCKGVQRGDRVALFMSKSVQSVIAIYAIMKAGAAYIPLDPSAPIDRLRSIVADSRVRCLLTSRKKLEDARRLQCGEPCVPWDQIDGARGDINQEILAGPDDVSYILYTSGTTGTPKGIVHTHFSSLAFSAWAATEYGLTSTDRVSSHAPFHFDLSTFDLFSAALAGATTVLIPEVLTTFPAAMVRFIKEERISVWYSVPYALIQMLERGNLEGAGLDSLRWVLFAGEPFPPKHLRRLISALPARFSNLYGPTETNVCTCHHVDHPPDEASPIPIGRLCPGMESLVLEDELFISGPTVTRGYLGRPDLDDCSFVRHSGRRYYRTGDLVKRDADGNYHYVGRKDRQIKARGHRIELDEIEAALLSHPDVSEAAVYATPDGLGSNRIEAVVNARRKAGITAAALLQHVLGLLPTYPAPSAILFLDEFPRTSTGKVDRRMIESSVTPSAGPTGSLETGNTLVAAGEQEDLRPIRRQ
jgi:amino acid adenylation domain-containing protein